MKVMDTICKSSAIKNEITCYACIANPFIYTILLLFCLYCMMRCFVITKSCFKSIILFLLYILCQASIIARIFITICMFMNWTKIMKYVDINIDYIKDMLILMFIARLFETLDCNLSRSNTDYKLRKRFIIFFVIIHTIGYYLVTFFDEIIGLEVLPVLYRICALGVIEFITIVGTITYIKGFKEISPDGFQSLRRVAYALFALINISLISRICLYLLVNFLKWINITSEISKAITSIMLSVMTEILPLLILFIYIYNEFKNTRISVLTIGFPLDRKRVV